MKNLQDTGTHTGAPRRILAAGANIATVCDEPEAEANARLIAAAPDLLRACRIALTGQPPERVRQYLQEAVEKATGNGRT